MQQLDIFQDSRDVMLRNDVIGALEQHDATSVRAGCDRLEHEFPRDESLAAFRTLAEAIEQSAGGLFGDHMAVRRARLAVEEAVRPAALNLLGADGAKRWLAPLWASLARRSAALPFRASEAQDHAAALWRNAGNWQAVADATSRIESWRRVPVPLCWMVEARLHLFGLQANWPLIAELGWIAPARLHDLLHRSQEPLLSALVRRFDAQFEGAGDETDAAWFVPWVLTERPEVAAHVAAAQPAQHDPPERALRVLIELLGLERQGRQREIVLRRKELRGLHGSLFAAYMKSR